MHPSSLLECVIQVYVIYKGIKSEIILWSYVGVHSQYIVVLIMASLFNHVL